MPEAGPQSLGERSQAYYQEVSLAVGLAPWFHPNPRHEQLKLIVDEVLDGKRGLRILDVGCGTGVMSDHLLRHGDVVAIDVSEPAVTLGRRLSPRVEFRVAQVQDLQGEAPFDVVTMFDVLEHIPLEDRSEFLRAVRALVADDGLVLASTPHPAYTRWLRLNRPDAMQLVDEEVELSDVVTLSSELGLDLGRYETFDIDGRRQYQVFVLERGAGAGGAPRRRPALARRLRIRGRVVVQLVRRARLAVRSAARGDWQTASRALRGGGAGRERQRP